MHRKLLEALVLRLGIILLALTILIMILLCPKRAEADTYGSFGLGVFSSALNSSAEAKFFNIGYRESLWLDLTHQVEMGFWTDNAGQGRKGSFYAAWQIGVEVTPGWMVTRFMVGPAFVAAPDQYLGGRFPQFSEDLYVGVRDSRNRQMGIKYKHLSSAGLTMPNMGRDFIAVEASIPW